MQPFLPGRGWAVYEASGRKISVISLLGQAGFKRVHLKNPCTLLPKLLDSVTSMTRTIIVDFHTVTTAEKATMFFVADGKVYAVVGTHTKAITAPASVAAQDPIPAGAPGSDD
jgi:calcineurin-like phosphoesterase